MKFNLQWLAIIPIIYAVWSFVIGLTGVPLLFGTEIEPMIGLVLIVISLLKCLASAGLAWLLWRAFR